MKNLIVKETGKWLLKGYIVWSICADLFLLVGFIYLLMKYG